MHSEIKAARHMIAFGPVPSRRLGQSLGIKNIPPKLCTYSCVYCQIGKTSRLVMKRRPFYKTGEVFESVRKQVRRAQKKAASIDYLTFVPDGEPTLDINLGEEIDQLKALGIKVAVITNASLTDCSNICEAKFEKFLFRGCVQILQKFPCELNYLISY